MVGTLMTNEEWERTKETRSRLVHQMGQLRWRELTIEQADAVVRAEHETPGTGAAAVDRFIANIDAPKLDGEVWRSKISTPIGFVFLGAVVGDEGKSMVWSPSKGWAEANSSQECLVLRAWARHERSEAERERARARAVLSSRWLVGYPAPEEVRAHAAAHPFNTGIKGERVGVWLLLADGEGTRPTTALLGVDDEGDVRLDLMGGDGKTVGEFTSYTTRWCPLTATGDLAPLPIRGAPPCFTRGFPTAEELAAGLVAEAKTGPLAELMAANPVLTEACALAGVRAGYGAVMEDLTDEAERHEHIADNVHEVAALMSRAKAKLLRAYATMLRGFL